MRPGYFICVSNKSFSITGIEYYGCKNFKRSCFCFAMCKFGGSLEYLLKIGNSKESMF